MKQAQNVIGIGIREIRLDKNVPAVIDAKARKLLIAQSQDGFGKIHLRTQVIGDFAILKSGQYLVKAIRALFDEISRSHLTVPEVRREDNVVYTAGDKLLYKKLTLRKIAGTVINIRQDVSMNVDHLQDL